VQPPDRRSHLDERFVARDEVVMRRPDDGAADEREDLAARLVDADRSRRAVEPLPVEVAE
jgi:hypothetical protein